MPTTLIVPDDFATCPHDRGPGIAVCLRCRADASRRSAASRRRLAGRVAIVAAVAFGLVSVSNTGLLARGHVRATTGALAPAETFLVAQAGSVPAAPAVLAPLVPEGETTLPMGALARRTGDSVSVHFDTPLLRTRRPEKFEAVVRATLGAVYGAAADSALAAVPEGALPGRVNLLAATAPVIALPSREGWSITLRPVTRPGQEGPLVVAYRAAATPAR